MLEWCAPPIHAAGLEELLNRREVPAKTIEQRLLDHRQAQFGRNRLALRIGRGDGDRDVVAGRPASLCLELLQRLSPAAARCRMSASSGEISASMAIFTRRSRSTRKRAAGLVEANDRPELPPLASTAPATAVAWRCVAMSVITATDRSKFGASFAVMGIGKLVDAGLQLDQPIVQHPGPLERDQPQRRLLAPMDLDRGRVADLVAVRVGQDAQPHACPRRRKSAPRIGR